MIYAASTSSLAAELACSQPEVDRTLAVWLVCKRVTPIGADARPAGEAGRASRSLAGRPATQTPRLRGGRAPRLPHTPRAPGAFPSPPGGPAPPPARGAV